MPNYATKKELKHATGVDASDLVAKKDFAALKAEVNKRDINKVVNVLNILNNLKTKVDDLDLVELKTVSSDLKTLNTKFNTLNTKVNELDKKVSDATFLICINYNNANKQHLEGKIENVDKKLPVVSGLVTATFLTQKLGKLRIKYGILVI